MNEFVIIGIGTDLLRTRRILHKRRRAEYERKKVIKIHVSSSFAEFRAYPGVFLEDLRR